MCQQNKKDEEEVMLRYAIKKLNDLTGSNGLVPFLLSRRITIKFSTDDFAEDSRRKQIEKIETGKQKVAQISA